MGAGAIFRLIQIIGLSMAQIELSQSRATG
jgi:hypothetical protein